MTRRRIVLFCTGWVVVAVAGLLVAGSQHLPVRTFAMGAPNQLVVTTLRPGTRVCEGPVTSDGSAQDVRIWGAPASGRARLTVDVDSGARSVLAHGTATAAPVNTLAQTERTVALDHAVPGGRPLRVCLTEDAGTFTLLGYPAVTPSVVMTGPESGSLLAPGSPREFSLVLLSAPNHSLLGELSTAFARASLWRPSWVGSWTFWLLTAAFLGAFGLAGVAVVLAASSDEGDGREIGDEPIDDDRPPTVDDSSGARARRAVVR